jgi:hypothetical protein
MFFARAWAHQAQKPVGAEESMVAVENVRLAESRVEQCNPVVAILEGLPEAVAQILSEKVVDVDVDVDMG